MTGHEPDSSPDSNAPGGARIPSRGVLLGLDYGSKRLGAAVSTESQSLAVPVENYDRRTEPLDAEWLKRLARNYSAAGLVVGLPVHMSGDEGGKAADARRFGEWAARVTGLPVAWWDERYSSAVADMYLGQTGLSKKKRKGRRDSIAAQVILQAFLDSSDRTQRPGSLDAETPAPEALDPNMP